MKTITQFCRFSFLLFLFLQSKINAQNSPTQLSLSPIFSNHMVFQQNNINPIWGKATPGTNIVVKATWGESSKVKTDKSGNWMLKLKTPSYGGPYSINIKSGDNQIELNDVLIGEVWLASGQSNMEWKMSHCAGCIDNQDYEIANANYPEIRMFNVPMDLYGIKINDQNWKVANPQNVTDFSATAYFFARELHQKMEIPIGIINTSWGGTRVEAWTSPKKLNELGPTNHINHQEKYRFDDKIRYNDSIVNGKEKFLKPHNLNDPNEYSILYHSMLKPIIPFGIKGVIWYQGEANVGNYYDYSVLLDGMISDWRSQWNDDFSFYFAQIAPFIYSKKKNSQGLRDAQRKVLNITPKTGMAILLDIGEENDIHPRNKQDVGKRLALLALKRDYGFNIIDSGPLYSKHEIKNGYIEVEFDHIGSGLIARGELAGFEIAGSDGVYFPANAEIKNDKVHVHSERVEKPKNVRYGWKNYFEATLFNLEGLPGSSFSSVNP